MAATACEKCGGPVPVRQGRGRPAKFCTAACKAKAYRARKRADAHPGAASAPAPSNSLPASGAADSSGGTAPGAFPAIPPRAARPPVLTEARVRAQLRAQPGGRAAASQGAPVSEARSLAADLAEAAAQLAIAIDAGRTGTPPPASTAELLGYAQRTLYGLGVLAHTPPAPKPTAEPTAERVPAVCDEQPAPVADTVTAGAGGGDVQGEPEEREEQEEAPDRPVPSGQLRAVARLGAEWAIDDDDVLWWQRTTRVGSVVKAWPGSGWQARHSTGRRVTPGAGRGDRYPSRIRALIALAAEFDRARRERTPHADMEVDGLPDGWRLTQTLAEHDDGRWRLHAPGGEITGTLTRETYGGRHAEWRATTGDPGHDTALRTTVTPMPDDPARGSDFDLFRTRTGAARALAAWHDPDLYDL